MKLSKILNAKSDACRAIENLIESLSDANDGYAETIRTIKDDPNRNYDVKYYEIYIEENELKIEYFKKALKAIENA